MTTPRIYVADLAAYNAGILRGKWIDADQSAEDIDREIKAMLLRSPESNVTRCTKCFETQGYQGEWGPQDCDNDTPHDPAPSAEEYAIHDYEGFGDIALGEFGSIERVSMLAGLLSDHESAVVSAALDHCGGDADAKEIEDWISDCYAGTARTLEDWAAEYLDDSGQLSELPEWAKNYFDFEAFARDLELGGDVFTVAGGQGVIVFWNR
jgi:antirestriction protein